MSIISVLVGILGIILGIYSIKHAKRVSLEKKTIENIVQNGLGGLAGNILKIKQSTNTAYIQLGRIQELVLKLSHSKEINRILKEIQIGHGAASASNSMLMNLLNEVLNTQYGLFNKKEIYHPEERELKQG
ncbi:MAG: hypothetical protein PHU44_14020 [Syntrophales bacterium]|nr:hypothetical protein [Syntrophales bacterium]